MAGYLGSTPVPQATQHRESFTATSGQTTFATAGYTAGFVDVYLNGSHLSPADFTATNGSDVVLASGASADDVCDIISHSAFEVNSQTFTGDVTFADGADIITASAGTSNFRAGVNAGNSIASGGNYNVTVGDEAGTAITTGDSNTALGFESLKANTTAIDNTAVGYQAGLTNITGSFNTFIGDSAGRLATHTRNTFIGHGSGEAMTTGERNCIFGRYNGNNGGLDIRATNNNIVISDGDGNPRIIVNSIGAVTQPAQPAFLARPASTQSNIAANNSAVTVVFGTEIFDQNADFTSNTFTAPVAGRYQFNYGIYTNALDSAAAYYETALVTSNRTYYMTIDPDFGQDNTHWAFNLAVLADMDASDTALVYIYQNGGTAQTDITVSSFFSGYLVA